MRLFLPTRNRSKQMLLWLLPSAGKQARYDWWSEISSSKDQSEVRSLRIVTFSHMFTLALRRLLVFSLTFDWFIWLSALVVIGHGYYRYLKTHLHVLLSFFFWPFSHYFCRMLNLASEDWRKEWNGIQHRALQMWVRSVRQNTAKHQKRLEQETR